MEQRISLYKALDLLTSTNISEFYEDIVMKLKPEKNSGLNGIGTHNLCDTGAVLYRLSYHTNWELVTL